MISVQARNKNLNLGKINYYARMGTKVFFLYYDVAIYRYFLLLDNNNRNFY